MFDGGIVLKNGSLVNITIRARFRVCVRASRACGTEAKSKLNIISLPLEGKVSATPTDEVSLKSNSTGQPCPARALRARVLI